MQLHNLPRRPVRSWLHRRVLAPGAAESRTKPLWGRAGAPDQGRRPSERCSACGQVQRAPGRGRRARGATLTFGCLQISRGRCSAWLGHVSPRTWASLARHGALRAGHPRRGSPGSRGGRLGSGDLAGCAPAARPLHRRRPGPPGPAGPRAAARVRPGSATRTGRQRLGRLRGRPRVRSLAARRSQPQPPGSVLLRCPHLLQLSSARSRSRGREAGAEWGREREGSPCSRPRVPATPRSRAAGGEGAGAARPPPVRPAGTEAGGAPGPAGRGRGRRGAPRAACAGWAIWREWSGRERGAPARRRPSLSWRRRWKEPPAAAACARGSTAARPQGFWAAGGAARPGNLLSLPSSRLWSSWRAGDLAFLSREGSPGSPSDGCLLASGPSPA